jgi:hypothetical protein
LPRCVSRMIPRAPRRRWRRRWRHGTPVWCWNSVPPLYTTRKGRAWAWASSCSSLYTVHCSKPFSPIMQCNAMQCNASEANQDGTVRTPAADMTCATDGSPHLAHMANTAASIYLRRDVSFYASMRPHGLMQPIPSIHSLLTHKWHSANVALRAWAQAARVPGAPDTIPEPPWLAVRGSLPPPALCFSLLLVPFLPAVSNRIRRRRGQQQHLHAGCRARRRPVIPSIRSCMCSEFRRRRPRACHTHTADAFAAASWSVRSPPTGTWRAPTTPPQSASCTAQMIDILPAGPLFSFGFYTPSLLYLFYYLFPFVQAADYLQRELYFQIYI